MFIYSDSISSRFFSQKKNVREYDRRNSKCQIRCNNDSWRIQFVRYSSTLFLSQKLGFRIQRYREGVLDNWVRTFCSSETNLSTQIWSKCTQRQYFSKICAMLIQWNIIYNMKVELVILCKQKLHFFLDVWIKKSKHKKTWPLWLGVRKKQPGVCQKYNRTKEKPRTNLQLEQSMLAVERHSSSVRGLCDGSQSSESRPLPSRHSTLRVFTPDPHEAEHWKKKSECFYHSWSN